MSSVSIKIRGPQKMKLLNYYTFASPYPQKFSIPSSIIYYIVKNPCSSKGYKNLQKTCKYFFSKNPVMIVDKFRFNVEEIAITLFHDARQKNIEIKKIDLLPYKIWITREIDIFSGNKINVSNLFQSFFKLDVRELSIQGQNLSFDELLLFASSPYIEDIWFYKVNIKYFDGSMVPIEKILELFPKVNNVTYYVNDGLPITSETVKTLMENPNFKKIKHMSLNSIPETFDLKCFYELVKQQKQTSFWLYFCEDVSQNYKTQLQIFAENVVNLAKSDETYFPPYISMPAINWDTYWDIFNYCRAYKKNFFEKGVTLL